MRDQRGFVWLNVQVRLCPLYPWVALALVVGVTVVATLIPVGRAARIDPALSLRFE